jgi:hypothetical protein
MADRDGSITGGTRTLSLLLSDQQARVVIESLSNVGATAERPVPDAAKYLVDTTSDDRNTFSISSPSRAVIDSGSYVATSWEFEYYSPRRWRVELEFTATT